MRMDIQNSCAASLVRRLNDDPPVEPTWPQERLVKHIRSVGSGDDDHAFAARESVHLGQDLIERLLAFVIATKGARATCATDGVQLVDEDDGGRGGAGLSEQVAHPTGTHADDHFYELTGAHAEERHVGLPRHCAREE